MPSGASPRAQVAFKDSMIRGILQFTLRIAFRCVLHRCKSQDIRCRESFSFFLRIPPCRGVSDGAHSKSAPRPRRGGRFNPPSRQSGREEGTGHRTAPTPTRAQAGHRNQRPLRERPRFAGFARMCDNDPSAGSPTETLLRLLLPLNGKV